jgi:hypothetical protein
MDTNTLLPFMPASLLILGGLLMLLMKNKQKSIMPEFLELSEWFKALDANEVNVSQVRQQYKNMQDQYQSEIRLRKVHKEK